MNDAKKATERLAQAYADRGNPNGWFEEFYARAAGDIKEVYWADLKPHPLLLDWIERSPVSSGKRAITIGCGLGDDAQVLMDHGYEVIAFDISPSAIEMCRQRYPDSTVDFRVADLFAVPPEWKYGFDLVYECNTIQILQGASRGEAIQAIADLTAPRGEVIVSCRSREKGEQLDDFPLPLDRDEIAGFLRAGLSESHFVAYNDDQDPPVPHFFAVYKRSN